MRNAVNPDGLYDAVQFGFSHAVKSEGSRILHLAGQVAWDAECNLVGPGDLATQTQQALKNLAAVLQSEGATPANIVRLRTYVVNHTPDKLDVIVPAIAGFFGDTTPAANTLIGVQTLAMPDFLIEIEATAILA